MKYAALVIPAFLATYLTTQSNFSDWSAPVNLGPVVNSAFVDAGPALSRDRRSLYFNSTRPGFGASDIWVSRRSSVEEAWGPPINIGAVINSVSGENHPNLSGDGHWLFFTSNRPGSAGMDIWKSYRADVHDDLAWQPPVNAGPGVNSAADEQDASFFENDNAGVPQLFFARGADIYVSEQLPDGTFGPAVAVSALNSTSPDRGISVRFDGLEAFFLSDRSGGVGLADLWTATRRTVRDPWSSPTNLGPLVNSVDLDQVPDIAADRETLHFASNRTGGHGGLDLYVTTRKQKP